MTDDISGDTSGDGRWLTFDELANLRGITRASAERLAQRSRWSRQLGNDQAVRVLVPTDSLSGGKRGADAQGLIASALARLEATVAALTGRAEADWRAEQAEARADAERIRTETAERQMAQAEKDRDMAIAAHNRLATEVDALRSADRARRAAGRLARIKAAWRGE